MRWIFTIWCLSLTNVIAANDAPGFYSLFVSSLFLLVSFALGWQADIELKRLREGGE